MTINVASKVLLFCYYTLTPQYLKYIFLFFENQVGDLGFMALGNIFFGPLHSAYTQIRFENCYWQILNFLLNF